jgi:hypothetical protein
MRKMWAFMIAGGYVAFAAACSSGTCDHTNDAANGTRQQPATCVNFIQRLVDCEVVAGTQVSGCEDSDPRLPCLWDCMEKASCKQIKVAYCNDVLNGYAGCVSECHAIEEPFQCDDGSQIPLVKACDGTPDCPNGEDEDCTQGYYTCADGSQIPESWQCDHLVQCPGGDDEDGCPPGPMFTCDDGTTIDASLQCNGVNDCAGAEDEYNCAKLTCN